MPYTSIKDNSTLDLTQLKAYLRLDADDTTLDTILTIGLDAAKEAADSYCQDNFDTVPSRHRGLDSIGRTVMVGAQDAFLDHV